MPHSLRAKLSGLRYKGILEDKDYKRLCKALDNENVLDKIRAEIESKEMTETTSEHEFYNMALNDVLQIIDKFKGV